VPARAPPAGWREYVSARGGLIQLFAYEESGIFKSTFKGIEGADRPAPELVHIKN
jgi:hypothetical protein